MDLVGRWLEQHVAEDSHLSPGRRRHLLRFAAHIVEAIGSVPCSEVQPKHMTAAMRMTAAPTQQVHIAKTLRQILIWGRAESLVYGPDRLRAVRLPRSRRREVLLEPDQWVDMYQALDASKSIAAALLQMTMLTGCRPTEISLLEWGQVSLRWRTMQALPATTKNKEGRIVQLPRAAVVLLRAQPTSKGLVFAGARHGKPIQSSLWGQTWHRCRRRAKVPECPPYTVRHTWITRALDLGYLPHEIGQHVGTSPRVILESYAHSTKARRRKMAEDVP